eukprot:gene18911-20814_t
MKTSAENTNLDDHDYLSQRQKNNIAVRKSREKSRQKIKETKERVDRLKKQNVELVNQLELLNRELAFLKDLFNVQYAKGECCAGSDVERQDLKDVSFYFEQPENGDNEETLFFE